MPRISRRLSLWESESSKHAALVAAARLNGFLWSDDFDLTLSLRHLCGSEQMDDNGFMSFGNGGINKFLRYLFDAGIDVCTETPELAAVESNDFYVQVFRNLVNDGVINEEGSVLPPHSFGNLATVFLVDIKNLMERYVNARAAYIADNSEQPIPVGPNSSLSKRLYKLIDIYIRSRTALPVPQSTVHPIDGLIDVPCASTGNEHIVPEERVQQQDGTEDCLPKQTKTEAMSSRDRHAKLEHKIERLEAERRYWAAAVEKRKRQLARAERKLEKRTEQMDLVEEEIRQILREASMAHGTAG